MRQAPFLLKSDTIELVAPSFGVTTEPYLTRSNEAIKQLKKHGFKIKEGACVHLEEGVAASASAEKRGKEIMDAFKGEASLILSVGGGETMNEILPYIDFEEIKRLPPKWFMGFSDNTNLTFTLATLSDLVTIYGPCAPQFFMKKWRLSEFDAMRMLMSEKHFEGYPKYSITRQNPLKPLWTYRLSQPKIIVKNGYEEPFKGILLGGCLDCLLNICGTRFDKVKEFIDKHKEEKIIWFLEACDLSPLSLRRGLFELKEAGWFSSASGFLLGRHLCRDYEQMGVNKYNAVTDMLSSFSKPILMDIDLGHISPSMPILTGAKATVSLLDGNIIIDYE